MGGRKKTLPIVDEPHTDPSAAIGVVHVSTLKSMPEGRTGHCPKL